MDDAWSNLGDMHINHEAVVAVDLIKLILSQRGGVDVFLDVNMLERQNHVGVSELVAWSIHVEHLDVLVNLVFVHTEVEVLLGGHLTEGVGSQVLSLFLGDLLFKTGESDFFLDQFVDSLLYLGNFRMVV